MSSGAKCNILGRVCGGSPAGAREVEHELRFESIEGEDEGQGHPSDSASGSKAPRADSCQPDLFTTCDDEEAMKKFIQRPDLSQVSSSGGYATAAGKIFSRLFQKEDQTASGAGLTAETDSDSSLFFSCHDEEVLDKFLKTVPVRATRDVSFEASEAPEDQLIRELRDRLVDVLGPVGLVSCDTSEARKTVDAFGNYRICCWRFLKACNGNIDAAEKKLRKTFAFREDIAASCLICDPDACRVFEELRDAWPEELIGSTEDGSPVSYFYLPKAVKFLQLGLTEEQIRTFWLVWMEKSLELQRDGRARASDAISSNNMPASVVVYDLEGLRLSQLTSCLGGLQIFCRVIGMAEEHYPQNLRKAIIVNAPGFFSRMVWPLVQKVLDEETLSNICVCSSEVKDLQSEQLGFSTHELLSLLGNRLSH
eukprot:TRINITY_DN28790_c0_g1_i1.p1 TRINITY_DN28790_c0_g1~~TRINITY_DN28790_c0_g1_i1.p1  ORF type:complete len:423 (+),score=93.16 TRINITY_DN28790_c0_g1_i1:33-1301(+)